ncbi:MAG: hypothetical protein FWE58_06210, partial [Methanobrevibacter sp.]|nr:hypothetical protein [Methanobrevibacter sp.]
MTNDNTNNKIEDKVDNSNSSEPRAYKRERQKGERWDGYKIKRILPFHKMLPYLMKTRVASTNYFEATYEADSLVEYLNKKNEELKLNNNNETGESIEKYGYNQFFIAALVRVIALRPHLNRFIANKTIYQRHNIVIGYVLKKEFSDEGEESTTVSTFERDSNIEDVRKILTKEIKGVKESSDDEAGDFIGVLMKLPKFIISFVIWMFDFFIIIGHMPKSLRGVDVMQASAFVANLGSIGLKGAPYHHLFDRGTCSLFVTLGRVRKDFVITEDGIVE